MLNNLRRAVFGVAVSALLAASPALADWEADFLIKPIKSDPGTPTWESKGKMYTRSGVVRMDMGEMSTIIDRKKHTTVSLMHARKVVMQMDTSHYDADFPSCDKKDLDKCLAAQGYKKTGSERANGHPCDIYEKDIKRGNGVTMHMKVWTATDLEESIGVRTQSTDANGSVTESNLTNVKVKDQPDSLFTVPPGYQRMQSPGLPGPGTSAASPAPLNPSDFQGKSPEELQEMLKKRGLK